MSRVGQGTCWRLIAAALLLVVATGWPAAAKAGPAAGAAGSGSPLLAAVNVGLEVDQVLDGDANVAAVAGVELALAAPRSWAYLDDLERFTEDAKWRLEVDAQGLAGRCLEPSVRLKTRVRGYQQFGGGNKAGELSLSLYAARVCEPSPTAGPVRGLLTTTDPLGYVDGPNLYQYAGNNPVNFSDPMGLELVQNTLTPQEKLAIRENMEQIRLEKFGQELLLEQDLFDSRVRYEGLDFWSAGEKQEYAFNYFRHYRGKNTSDASTWAGYLAGQGECDRTQPHCLVNWEALTTGVQVMEAGVMLSLIVFDPLVAAEGIAVGGVDVAAYRAGLASDIQFAIRQRVLANLAENAAGYNTGFFSYAARTNVGSGNAYSVAYRTKLPSSAFPGRSRAFHFQEANRLLLEAMGASPEFAGMMETLIPGVRSELTGPRAISRRPPSGWTWHHHVDEGVMELVPHLQHVEPGPLQQLFHPGGRGGFAIWGKR